MRFSLLLPLTLTMGAFILGMLCLFAGNKPGFMEDYDIITLNASTLGYSTDDPEPTTTATAATAEATETGGIRSWLSDKADNITDKLSDKFDDFKDDLQDSAANRLAEALGIQEWYSLHLLDMCMGTYAPNATEKGASKNTTQCTQKKAMYKFDPTRRLEGELTEGPLGGKVTLQDLGYPDEIQDGINAINGLLGATFVLYCIGIALSSILIILSLAALFFHGPGLPIANLLLAFLAFLAFGIGSAILTAFMIKASSLINENGNDIGLYAHKGNKFLALTWAAAGMMLLAFFVWLFVTITSRKDKKIRVPHADDRHRVEIVETKAAKPARSGRFGFGRRNQRPQW